MSNQDCLPSLAPPADYIYEASRHLLPLGMDGLGIASLHIIYVTLFMLSCCETCVGPESLLHAVAVVS